MKRILTFFLALTMVLPLAACGGRPWNGRRVYRRADFQSDRRHGVLCNDAAYGAAGAEEDGGEVVAAKPRRG